MSISKLGGQVSQLYSSFKPTSAKKGAGLLYNKAALRLSKELAPYDEALFGFIKKSMVTLPPINKHDDARILRWQETVTDGQNLLNYLKRIYNSVGFEVSERNKRALPNANQVVEELHNHLNTRSVKELQQITSQTIPSAAADPAVQKLCGIANLPIVKI